MTGAAAELISEPPSLLSPTGPDHNGGIAYMSVSAQRLSPEDQALYLKQYVLLVDFVKHGLDLILKLNVFYYAATGAIVSFYLSRPEAAKPTVRFALLLPLIMGVGCVMMSGIAAWTAPKGSREVKRIADLLGFEAYPEPVSLGLSHVVSILGFLLVVLGLLVLIIWPNVVGV